MVCSCSGRGTLALQRLCQLLDAERVYWKLATILEQEVDLEFATIMVQVSFNKWTHLSLNGFWVL